MTETERAKRVAISRFLWRTEEPAYIETWGVASLVEEEIERRGLQRKYLTALFGLLGYEIQPFAWGVEVPGMAALWKLLRAKPEQRCEAALKALEATNG